MVTVELTDDEACELREALLWIAYEWRTTGGDEAKAKQIEALRDKIKSPYAR